MNKQVSAQNENLSFTRITSEQGLSNDGVMDIIRDERGFMWFATIDGLDRYDGYTFKTIKPKPNDVNTMSAASVNNLYMDSYGLLWINNISYLCTYNDALNTFERRLPDNWVTTWCEDTVSTNSPCMWIATFGEGLYRWSRKEDKFTRFFRKTEDPESLSSDSVFSVSTDADGNLWVGTAKGLNSLDSQGNKFKHYLNGPQGQVYEINVDQFTDKGLIWMGAEDGLYSYDVNSGIFQHYLNQYAGRLNPNDNDVRTLYVDSRGILWVGMIGGIGGFDTERNNYFNYDNQIQSSPLGFCNQSLDNTGGQTWYNLGSFSWCRPKFTSSSEI